MIDTLHVLTDEAGNRFEIVSTEEHGDTGTLICVPLGTRIERFNYAAGTADETAETEAPEA